MSKPNDTKGENYKSKGLRGWVVLGYEAGIFSFGVAIATVKALVPSYTSML